MNTNYQYNRQDSMKGPLIAIAIGLFMVILDGTAINIAIQGFIKQFNQPLSVVHRVTSGYALALAAVIPLAGWLSIVMGQNKSLSFL